MSSSPNNPQHDSDADFAEQAVHHNPMVRWLFFVLGVVFMVLAVIGMILPAMPTTVFVLLAGYCWAKSSTRFYRWLMRHKLFGKMMRDWQERRAMPRFAKYMAWGMMGLSNVVLIYRLPADKWWVAMVVGTLCLATAIWMARLPDA